MTVISRRGFLRCLTGVIAAPAIIKVDRLMKLSATPIRFVFYSNRSIRSWDDVAAINDRNILLSFEDIPGAAGYNILYSKPKLFDKCSKIGNAIAGHNDLYIELLAKQSALRPKTSSLVSARDRKDSYLPEPLYPSARAVGIRCSRVKHSKFDDP
jgi:hypothetical protein